MDRYNKVYVETMKKLDRLENDYLPQVTLTQKEVSIYCTTLTLSHIQTPSDTTVADGF